MNSASHLLHFHYSWGKVDFATEYRDALSIAFDMYTSFGYQVSPVTFHQNFALPVVLTCWVESRILGFRSLHVATVPIQVQCMFEMRTM